MRKPKFYKRIGLLLATVLPWITSSGLADSGGPQLGGFWIVDADTDQLYERLAFDDLIDLNHAPEFLSVIVDPVDPVGSVVFTLDGVVVQTENSAPYAIAGDSAGDYSPIYLSTGFHIIEAVAYSGPNGSGDAGPPSIVTFEVGRSDFVVDTVVDSHDAKPGDSFCQDRRGHCTLRAAIEEANALPGRQWVHVPTGNYSLNLGTIKVTDRVTVRGAHSSTVVIDGENKNAFRIESLRSDFDEITVTGAHGQGGGGAFIVESGAELKMLNNRITGNTANGGPGAGLFNAGTTTIRRSIFSDNDAGFYGICGGGQTAYGGAINNNSTGKLRIYGSAIIDNRAIRGGGLVNSGFTSISNSTFSGNLARGGGGAILNRTVTSGAGLSAGRLHLAYSTVTKNEANVPCDPGSLGDGDSESTSVGGGLNNYGHATVGSSIIAQNILHGEKTDDLYSPDCATSYQDTVVSKLVSAGGNVWGELNDSCKLFYPNGLAFDDCKPAQVGVAHCPLFNDIPILRDKWGTPTEPLDAELENLSMYLIPSHAIGGNSPALDFGISLPLEFSFLFCPDFDQINNRRPVESNGVCDSGARERF